jgi:2-amino-4-hydroxy-6-hydroxymethyldihydropteridine diphosphokinase
MDFLHPFIEINGELCSNRRVTSQVFIALGSNRGDRDLNLLRAVAEIGKITGTKITALSHFYDTAPVGKTDQPDFLNGVVRVETALPPEQLLEELQRIEREVFKRERTVHWGPRAIDLDILFYDGITLAGETLTIPHPRLHERRFVLQPLAEIASDIVHPHLGKSVGRLLAELADDTRVTRVEPQGD